MIIRFPTRLRGREVRTKRQEPSACAIRFHEPGHDVGPRDYVKHASSNTRQRPGDSTLSDPYETTEQHLDRLLRRALNSFDLPDCTVEQLGTALTHSSSLHSSHHSSVLHRETYRHTY